MHPPLYLGNSYTFKVPVAVVGSGKTGVIGKICATEPTATTVPNPIGDCEVPLTEVGKYYTGKLTRGILRAELASSNEQAVHAIVDDGADYLGCKTFTVIAVRPFL